VNCNVSIVNRRAAVEAFCLIAKNILIVVEKQHVLQLFGVLYDTGKLSLIEKLNIALCDKQIAIISNCDWSGAKHWVEW